ncbi:MAG: rRNA pseudouridine synthase [Chloroflexi bacterium]|nr:rRNA pseudouridine synthase [Chloroflexota bacterium]
MTTERLQKILARAGFGSRRASDKLIADGRVRLNGQTAELGAKADPAVDKITVDGQTVRAETEMVYFALNKPRGVISTTGGPDRRQKVTDLVPKATGLHIVGRLDAESEGLLLLTNDGRLTNWLTHPRYGHEKEYRVLVARQPDRKQLEAWQRGVVLADGHRTLPAQVRVIRPHGKGAWVNVIMTEGRKRQIRETAGIIGLPVAKLIRIRIGTLELGRLKVGEWRALTADEVQALYAKRQQA